MPLILFLLFVVVPLAEIAVFIVIGDIIGIPATIALVIVTALIGTMLLRMQGLSALQRTQSAIQEGRIPVDSVIDGVCLLVAGAFLLTPGIITDTVGFLLFIPQFRRWLAQAMFHRIIKSSNIEFSEFRQEFGEPPHHQREPNHGSGPIIDVEPIEVSPESTDHQGENGKSVKKSAGNNDRKSPWNPTSE